LQQCRDYLLAVAMRRLPARLQAKVGASDVAQEALTQAHANFDRFTGETESELLAWLARILEYRVLTVERKFLKTVARDVGREVSLDLPGDSSAGPFDLVRDTPGPSSRADAQEEHARLSEAMARLRPDDRQIIELRNLELLSFAEIGRRTERSADAVRKHWARAVERLQEELDR